MDFQEEIKKQQEIRKANIVSQFKEPDLFFKATNHEEFLCVNLDIEKAKKIVVGYEHGGYKVVGFYTNGQPKWQSLKKHGGGKEESSSVKTPEKPEDGKDNGDKQKSLEEHAKNSSEADLQRAIKEHKDEKVRNAAHQELERRKSEEHVDSDSDEKTPTKAKPKSDKGKAHEGNTKDGNEYDEEGKAITSKNSERNKLEKQLKDKLTTLEDHVNEAQDFEDPEQFQKRYRIIEKFLMKFGDREPDDYGGKNWIEDISDEIDDKQKAVEWLDKNMPKIKAKSYLDKDKDKYKRAKFVSNPAKEGGTFHDHDQAQPGYYNSRIIKKINGNKATIQVVDTFNGQNNTKGSEYEVPLSYVQKQIDKSDSGNHETKEDINEISHNIVKKAGIDKIKGGGLDNKSVIKELKKSIDDLKKAVEGYNEKDSSVAAGGFSGANSSTMRSSKSGSALSVEFNGVHHGGYYGGQTPFLVQLKVGGALDYKTGSGVLKACNELLSKFNYTASDKSYSKSRISKTDGTNWSSVMLTAPQNSQQYLTINELNSQ